MRHKCHLPFLIFEGLGLPVINLLILWRKFGNHLCVHVRATWGLKAHLYYIYRFFSVRLELVNGQLSSFAICILWHVKSSGAHSVLISEQSHHQTFSSFITGEERPYLSDRPSWPRNPVGWGRPSSVTHKSTMLRTPPNLSTVWSNYFQIPQIIDNNVCSVCQCLYILGKSSVLCALNY